MNRDCTITAGLKRAQVSMFNAAKQRGITATVIHYDTGGKNGGISLSTIGQWSRGESAMGLEMLIRLIGVIPDEILSLLLPDGHRIVPAPETIDHDELARLALDLAAEHAAARHPDSEHGVEIGPNEHNRLTAKATHLRAVAA